MVDEPLFLLHGSDPAAAAAVHEWVRERRRLELSQPDAPELKYACAVALEMIRYAAIHTENQ